MHFFDSTCSSLAPRFLIGTNVFAANSPQNIYGLWFTFLAMNRILGLQICSETELIKFVCWAYKSKARPFFNLNKISLRRRRVQLASVFLHLYPSPRSTPSSPSDPISTNYIIFCDCPPA